MLDKIARLVLTLRKPDQDERDVATMVLEIHVHVLAQAASNRLLHLNVTLHQPLDLDLLLSELPE